jgi:hypothetical protein
VKTPVVGCAGYVCAPFHNPKQHIGAVTLTSYALRAGNQTAPYETDRALAGEDTSENKGEWFTFESLLIKVLKTLSTLK